MYLGNCIAAFIAPVVFMQAVYAEPGITSRRITLGQSIGLTGPIAASAKEQIEGAQLYFDVVNKRGGVNGRKIEVSRLDDQFDPNITALNAKKLIQAEVFALFLFRGTSNVEAALPAINEARIPLIAPSTGAQSLHEPLNRLVFNVRPKFQMEVDRAVVHLHRLGITRIGIFYADDGFGNDAFAGFKSSMARLKLQPDTVHSYKRPMGDVSAVTQDIAKANPQALLTVGASGEITKFIKNFKSTGATSQIVTLSVNSSKSFIDGLGPLGRGTVIMQAVPSTHTSGMTVVSEYRTSAKTANVTPTNAGLEGYISAKVMVEGMLRAGRDLTREKLISAMESGKPIDVGGIRMNYSPNSRLGSRFVDITIVGAAGKLIY